VVVLACLQRLLSDPTRLPSTWRKFYPASFEPVTERLPENPAVVRGPDGVGSYGGTWRRCTRASYDLHRKIGYERFVRFGPSGEIQPCAAWKWTAEQGNRVFTFHLRKGHRWSDGHPFTAADIVWVCNTLIGSPHWPSPPNWI